MPHRSRRILHDVSMVVHASTPEWPGDVPYACGWTLQMASGANLNLAHFTMSPHVGTHADAPLHVLPGGTASDGFPLGVFHGPAFVLDLPAALRECAHPTEPCLSLEDLAPYLPPQVERLLLRTDASTAEGGFPAEWPALTAECVEALCARGLRLLGVDAPSVDPRDARELGTHRALFRGGAWNLENLDLRGVATGHYELVAYPLRLAGLDAAPVRAVLLSME